MIQFEIGMFGNRKIAERLLWLKQELLLIWMWMALGRGSYSQVPVYLGRQALNGDMTLFSLNSNDVQLEGLIIKIMSLGYL